MTVALRDKNLINEYIPADQESCSAGSEFGWMDVTILYNSPIAVAKVIPQLTYLT